MNIEITTLQLAEYKKFIRRAEGWIDQVSDSVYCAILVQETKQWLEDNNINADAYKFYKTYGE